MANANLIDRLSGLSSLGSVPQEELEWLVAHGHLEVHEPGAVVAQKGEPVEKLHIVLSGYVTIRVDRGAGPRRVTEWHPGEATGMLPYSRMTGPPGDNYVETRTETLAIHKEHFPLMIQCCPAFTGCTVHMMLDRARDFNSSDLQDEKMISLGKLAAGLAHELNNPASALASGAKQLLGSLADVEAASRALGSAGLTFDSMEQIEQMRAACLTEPAHTGLSPIQKADREDEIADWLARQQSDPVFAASLADTAVTMKELDTLLGVVSGNTLEIALHWIAAGCSTRTLICDMEQAANRIYELVAAVKKFTYMDNLAEPESVDVEAGLRDTVRVLASKINGKDASISLDVEPDLPRVSATGIDLNQVWLNLIDNALDAIPDSGRVDVSARLNLNRVVVRVIDNGPGIPPNIIDRVFDPFFTTKPPGQGTGLGLEITRRLVRRYLGDISVQSRPGCTEFLVSLIADSPSLSKIEITHRDPAEE